MLELEASGNAKLAEALLDIIDALPLTDEDYALLGVMDDLG